MTTKNQIVIHVASIEHGRANRRALARARLAQGYLGTGFNIIIDANGDTEVDQIVNPGDDTLVSVANPEVCLDGLMALANLLLSEEYRGYTVVVPKELQEWYETAVQPFMENE